MNHETLFLYLTPLRRRFGLTALGGPGAACFYAKNGNSVTVWGWSLA
jgi:hypothetical protein